MAYISAKTAVADIVTAAKTIGTVNNEAAATLFAQHFVTYVLNYCNRNDFPEACTLTGAAFSFVSPLAYKNPISIFSL